jgi:outer membrane protein assembly factor BamA
MNGHSPATARTLAALLLPWMLSAADGFSPVIGGLQFDSGIALGVEYRKTRVARSPLEVSAKAIGSVKKYEFLETGVAAPRLAGGLLFAEARARYRNYPEEDFWGLGPKSPKDRRTSFRLEDFDFTSAFGVRPKRWLEAGVTAGLLEVNTGPGKDKDWSSTEQIFSDADAPGLERQPHYFHSGALLRVDYRDDAADTRRGGFYDFHFTSFHDRTLGHFSFRRYQFDLRQFLPVFGERDTIAFRALATLSDKRAGRLVPFFMQPTVGGGGDLRGYRQSRFRDENVQVFNLEYRWRVVEMLHVVGFADAGRVFGRPGEIGFSSLRGSTDGGGRLKLGDRILFGMDLGWSPDGFRFWFRGAHTF